MNKIRIPVIATITFFVLGFSTIYLGRGFFNYKGELTKLNKQYLALSKDYTDLLKAKQQVIIKWDTIHDTIKLIKPVPFYIYDTIIGKDTSKVRMYNQVKEDSLVKIELNAKTLGYLLDASFAYTLKKKTTIINNTVYVDKPVEIIVYKEKTHLVAYGKLGYPMNFGFGLDLQRPKVIQYGLDYTNINSTHYISGKIGIKIF
jgi:hypothetical protein